MAVAVISEPHHLYRAIRRRLVIPGTDGGWRVIGIFRGWFLPQPQSTHTTPPPPVLIRTHQKSAHTQARNQLERETMEYEHGMRKALRLVSKCSMPMKR